MKTRFILSILAIGALFCSCAQEWGEIEDVAYPINESFTELEVSDGFLVVGYEPDNTPWYQENAIVMVGQKAQSKVKLEVKNGRLYVGFRSGKFITGNDRPKVYLPSTKLKYLTTLVLCEASGIDYINLNRLNSITLRDSSICGTTQIFATWNEDNTAQVGEINVDVKDGSKFYALIRVPDVNIKLSDGSYARFEDYSDIENLHINVNKGSEMKCGAANIFGTISEKSMVTAKCCNMLSVNVTDSSTLKYHVGADCRLSAFDCHGSGGSTIIEY